MTSDRNETCRFVNASIPCYPAGVAMKEWIVLTLGVVGLTSLSLATERAPASALHLARQLEQAFVQVAEQVSPSVVVITALQKTPDRA
ncbi:MAG: hypothetical protein N3A53_05970, partial [Verrucomicrobiae bacterium]|nr:hypothetical protein [Verrucomicrobiae bacterium]